MRIKLFSIGLVLVLGSALVWLIRVNESQREEMSRLRAVHEMLSDERTEAESAVRTLRMTMAEYERELRSRDGALDEQRRVIEGLRLKVKNIQSISQTVTATVIDTPAVFRPFTADTLSARDERTSLPSVSSSLGAGQLASVGGEIEWCDPWVSLRVRVAGDDARVELSSRDTLYQVVHRVPRKFLCIPIGTKGIRQEIVSSNPHTVVVYSEYIELVK